MNKIVLSIVITAIISFLSCEGTSMVEERPLNMIGKENLKAEQIISSSIEANGGEFYENAHYSFTFRGNSYRFKNNNQSYEYEYNGLNKVGDSLHVLLDENTVSVRINDQEKELNEKQKLQYSDNLNSVIYFATLPHKLGDKSVNKEYEGTTTILEKEYDVIKVTFNQEGGGTDYDDEYYYWINSATKLIDFLAYNYQVNGGGVRFRSAYNSRKVEGIIFQDYVNYKAEVGTPLKDLAHLYEQNQLKELSRIESENVTLIKELIN